jgi:hypothetical protein
MLGFVSKFGSAKGMVRVPNLSGLSVERGSGQNFPPAIQALINSGLKFSVSTAENTTVLVNDKKVKSQVPPVNTLVDYESEVSFVYNSYIVIRTFGNPENYNTVTNFSCSGTTRIPTTTTFRRRAVFDNEVFAFWEELASNSVTGQAQQQSTQCGYVVPPCSRPSETCGAPTAWSACNYSASYYAAGSRVAYQTCIRTNCTSYTKALYKCCQHSRCDPWSGWSGGAGGQSRSRTCYDADCNARTEYESRCAVQCGSWSNVGGCVSARQGQTRTCVRADCSTYKQTQTITCRGRL